MARKSKGIPFPVTAIPMPIRVQEDGEFQPVALVLDGKTQTVASRSIALDNPPP